MTRRLILSAVLALTAVAGLTLTPATASAHPYGRPPVYRPAYYPPHHHHHHRGLFGFGLYVTPPAPVVVTRPVYPAPVVVVPTAPAYTPYTPAPVVVPYPR